MGNREFDNYIKKQLDNIHTPLQPDDWDSMESLLDQEDMLADVEFDQFIKEGLTNIAPIYQANEWSNMEQLLDQEAVMADQKLDQFVKNGLEQIAPAYHSSEWSGMESKLVKKEKERKELVYIKGIELVLVILAALTLYMFIPGNNTQIQGSPFNDANQSIISSNDNMVNLDSEVVEKNTTNRNEIAARNIVNNEKIVTNNNIKKESYNSHPIIAVKSNPLSNNDSAILVPPTYSESNSKKNLNIIPLVEKENETIAPKEEISNTPETITSKEKDETILTLEPIASLNDVDIRLDQPDFKMAFTKAKPAIRMSYQIGLDRNHIMTPYDSETESSFKQGNYGFSAAVKTSVRKGRWEFETGLGYTKKQYNPSPVYQITGNTREGYQAETLKKLNFNMISVPLNLRFYLRNTPNKLNFYITSGAALNTVAWSNYDRYTYTIEDASNPEDFTDGRAPKLRNVQNAGIFNGESFRQNSYITASLGFGVEVNLDERVSFFTQPKFTYYLSPVNIGLGPNNDHFNTISVDLGLRFKL